MVLLSSGSQSGGSLFGDVAALKYSRRDKSCKGGVSQRRSLFLYIYFSNFSRRQRDLLRIRVVAGIQRHHRGFFLCS
jgi:hypothetical protein